MSRARYTPLVKQQVRARYGLCRTTADKRQLADELGIGSVEKLYNLASRLGAAGRAASDAAGERARGASTLVRTHPAQTVFTAAQDAYLRREFGRRSVEVIAYHLGHSEPAIAYRARRLALRRPVKLAAGA
jgi:hypothetical protein